MQFTSSSVISLVVACLAVLTSALPRHTIHELSEPFDPVVSTKSRGDAMVISSETSHSALPLHKKGRIPVPHASGMRSGSAKKVKPIKEAIKKPIEKLKDTKAGEKAFKALKKIKATVMLPFDTFGETVASGIMALVNLPNTLGKVSGKVV